MYEARQLMNYSFIVKNNVICTDIEIHRRNKFRYLAEAQEYCDDLNNGFTTVILSKEALEQKVK